MTENRQNFPDLALQTLLEIIDPEKAQTELFNFLHPGEQGSLCPFCGEPLTKRVKATFAKFGKCLCFSCRKQFSATTGTPFSSSSLTPAQIFILGVLVKLEAPPKVVARLLGRTLPTAISYIEKFKNL